MNKLIYLVIFSFLSTSIYAQMKDFVQYVNTLQGTDSHFGLSYGNTYPTTGMPYAMHTWSAQTGKNGADHPKGGGAGSVPSRSRFYRSICSNRQREDG